MKTIQEVILDYYEQNNIPYTFQGDYIRSRCFVHGGDNPTSLSVNLKTGQAVCFSKGCKLNTYQMFGLNHYYDYQTYKKEILNYEDQGLSKEYLEHCLFDESYLDLFEEPTGEYLDYLWMRGISEENIKDYDIRVCNHDTSKYYRRVIFPVRNYHGRIANFCMRTIDPDEKLRYSFLSRPKFNLFWNMNNLLLDVPVVLTEGVFDALALINAGVPNVFATLGLHMTKYQLEFLNSYLFGHIIFAYDNDDVSESRMNEQLKYFLKSGKNKKYGVMIPTEKDFGGMWMEDEYILSTYQQAVKNSLNGNELMS